jgi:leucyl/phenylalanyl-tRNA--protein transferase
MRLTAELILAAYGKGLFPMADPVTGEVRWFAPDPRGVLPLDAFHLPRRLARSMKRFELTTDRDFEKVIDGCADRPATWISSDLRAAYVALFRAGRAHSVEARLDGELAGGIYGVAIGGAFMAESMFHRRTDAGKAALVGLVDRLRSRGFSLCDIQMVTPATAQFGAIEIPRDDYLNLLSQALTLTPVWDSDRPSGAPRV